LVHVISLLIRDFYVGSYSPAFVASLRFFLTSAFLTKKLLSKSLELSVVSYACVQVIFQRWGDFVVSRGWDFEIIDADPKRIGVETLIGYYDDNDKDHNAVLGFLNKKNKNKNLKDDSRDESKNI